MKKTKKQQIQDKIVFLQDLGLQYAKDLNKNKTKWEIILYNILKEANYNFDFQRPVVVNKLKSPQLFILDFVLIPFNLIIEVDSKQHHSSSKDVKSDNRRTKLLKQEGYNVLRFWNNQLTNYTKNQILDIIAKRITSKSLVK
jgi:very-short-patch-repair endonuclease